MQVFVIDYCINHVLKRQGVVTVKKIICALVCFLSALFILTPLYACEKTARYEKYVSLLRQDIYCGNYKDLTVTAEYGFKENPFTNDACARERVYGFTFFIPVIPDEIKRTVSFTENGKTYSANFTVNEITSEYKAFIETEPIDVKGFTADIVSGSEIISVSFSSVVPANAVSYKAALSALEKEQSPLLSSFTDNGEFKAELYLKIFVKNEKPFWYVGIAYGNDRLKAFLLDGFTAETLAIREIA